MKTPHVGLSRLEPARVPLKEESGDLGEERLPDGEQLLRDDREHLDVDPVELVEARPAARLRHAREELAHHLVVELVGAVEDDALDGDALGEVLGRLGLARACGARGPASLTCRPPVMVSQQRSVSGVITRRERQPWYSHP